MSHDTHGHHDPHGELTTLLGRYCDGTATASDHQRLAAIVRDDPAARRHYLQYMALHADLQWNATASADATQTAPLTHDAVAAEPHTQTFPLSRALTGGAGSSSGPAPALSLSLVTKIAAAIVLIAGLGAVALMWDRDATPDTTTAQSEPIPASPRPTTVATVVDVTDAVWADASSAELLQPGTPLDAGSLHLKRGRAQVVLARGSIVTLLGGTRVDMIGDNACRLTRGRLAVYVPEWATGFTVHTPTATVTDLGTEFGVEVDTRGRTEVHVFQGLVEVGGADGDVSKAQRLTTGQARRFDDMTTAAGDVVVLRPGRFEHTGRVMPPLPPGVASVRGAVHPTDAPPSLARHRFEHNGRIALIAERRGVLLTEPLTVSYPRRPGLWAGPDLGDFEVPAGKKVDVYLLHFDPVGAQKVNDKNDKQVSLAGSVRFDRPILGVIGADAHLEASDELLGLPGVIYDASPALDRGMDAGFDDSITLSADRKELFLQAKAKPAIDQVRILVVAD